MQWLRLGLQNLDLPNSAYVLCTVNFVSTRIYCKRDVYFEILVLFVRKKALFLAGLWFLL